MPHARIVVIGASAGGFEAVRTVLRGLPGDFPAAVLVVIHTGPSGLVPVALARGSPLPVGVAIDRERLEPGRVYVAPPDRHLKVMDGVVRVAGGPREHGFRPAIDPLFTTAAEAAGPRAAGVILSGALSDGTIGLRAIKQAGGLTVVQAPQEAAVPSMPASALSRVAVDAVLPAAEIGRALAEWATNGARRAPARAPRDDGRRAALPVRAQERGLGALASAWREEAVAAESRADEVRRLIENVGAAPAARLVGAGLAVTREPARLSKERHQASRGRTRLSARPRRKNRRRR